MRKILITSIVLFLSACSVYKVDVRQGNVLETKSIDKLRVGMTKQQVLFIMGEPLLKDVFHTSRWDYPYFFTPGGKKTTRQLLTIYFDGDKVAVVDKSALEKIKLGKIN